MTLENSIQVWIDQTLSVSSEAFNGLPPCPFAKQALIDSKIVVKQLTISNCISVKQQFITELDRFSINWPKHAEVVVLGAAKDLISSCDLESAAEYSNHKFLYQRGYVVLEDHPDAVETVGDVVLNQGDYALMLLQNKQKLSRARHILQKQNYYKNWDPQYLHEVLSR